MRIEFIILMLLLSGCAALNKVGISTVADLNEHKKEAERFAQDATENQANIAQVVVGLVDEELREAKNDGSGVEHFAMMKAETNLYLKEAKKLSKTKYEATPQEGLNWLGAIQGLLMGGGPLAAIYALFQSKKIGRLKEKAIGYAQSTEKNDISQDKDLS